MPEEYYKEACKLGQKEARAAVSRGEEPTLSVLDEIFADKNTAGAVDLGLVEIPAHLITGVKSRGRASAFAPNFMPVLEETTEFAAKWKQLCTAHLTEGIRDPVKAYEYLNHFYIEEGNKRVSVLRYFDAVSIPATVTRILPEHDGSEQSELYYEFLDFYKLTGLYFLDFTKKGSYGNLLKQLDKSPEHEWSEDERKEFSAVYYAFRKVYLASGGVKLQSTAGDAMLSYIQVYGFTSLRDAEASEIKKNLSKMWEEVALKEEEAPIELKLDPADEKKPGVLTRVLSSAPAVTKVAFFYDRDPEVSGWAHDHEEGRLSVESAFCGKITTEAFYNALDGDPLEKLELAIADGYNLIFTTSPRLLQASLRAAVQHPDVIIMNCSLNKSHRYIRTYYTRMYEVKFILGALAGSLSESGRLGYVCDYPIYGQIAGINAFALGAQMVNPRAKVYLEWMAVKGAKAATQALVDRDIHLISSHDTSRFSNDDRYAFGLSYLGKEQSELLAVPVWKWGVYYEEILRRVLDKTVKAEYESSSKALNYYWGMSAGVVDIEYSAALSVASRRLADFLRDSIIQNVCTPFLAPLYRQDGSAVGEGIKAIPQEEIITMDYLVENVIGTIPKYDELSEVGKATVDMVGVDRSKESIPAEPADRGGAAT